VTRPVQLDRGILERYERHQFYWRKANGEPLSIGSQTGRITDRVRKIVDAANTGKTGACHLFRHTMATLMLENGADIRFIQAMLGHASLDTTQIYAQVGIRVLKTVHTATHPGRLPELGRKGEEAPEPTVDDLLDALAKEAAEDE
jgi:integrase/recombinase XerD